MGALPSSFCCVDVGVFKANRSGRSWCKTAHVHKIYFPGGLRIVPVGVVDSVGWLDFDWDDVYKMPAIRAGTYVQRGVTRSGWLWLLL